MAAAGSSDAHAHKGGKGGAPDVSVSRWAGNARAAAEGGPHVVVSSPLGDGEDPATWFKAAGVRPRTWAADVVVTKHVGYSALVVSDVNSGLLTLPGGTVDGVERGTIPTKEQFYATAERELEEEVGLGSMIDGDLILVRRHCVVAVPPDARWSRASVLYVYIAVSGDSSLDVKKASFEHVVDMAQFGANASVLANKREIGGIGWMTNMDVATSTSKEAWTHGRREAFMAAIDHLAVVRAPNTVVVYPLGFNFGFDSEVGARRGGAPRSKDGECRVCAGRGGGDVLVASASVTKAFGLPSKVRARIGLVQVVDGITHVAPMSAVDMTWKATCREATVRLLTGKATFVGVVPLLCEADLNARHLRKQHNYRLKGARKRLSDRRMCPVARRAFFRHCLDVHGFEAAATITTTTTTTMFTPSPIKGPSPTRRPHSPMGRASGGAGGDASPPPAKRGRR